MRIAILVGVLMLCGSAQAQQQSPHAAGDLITGWTTAVTGDSFSIGSERIRIWGIDAPQRHQRCNRQSKEWRPARDSAAALQECLRGTTVTCRVQKTQRRLRDLFRQRFVSECWRDDNKQDVAACMVRSGWATDYTGYSGGYYAALEAEPKAERRGLWQCDGTLPTRRWCLKGEGVPCEPLYKPRGPELAAFPSNRVPIDGQRCREIIAVLPKHIQNALIDTPGQRFRSP